MKAQLEANKAETEQHMLTVEQLRLDLEQGRTVIEETEKVQAEQSLEIEKLKVALGKETANVQNEREAKQAALKER